MNIKNVFVVGPDGTGKTAVSYALAERLGVPRFKCPTEKEMFVGKTFKEHLAFDLMLPDLVGQTGLSFVSDRGYPCEYAYSHALGRDTDMTMLRRIDDKWAELSDPPLHVLLAMDDYSNAREDDLVERGDLAMIEVQYTYFFNCVSRCPFIKIKVDRYGVDLWAEKVCNTILAVTGIESFRYADAYRLHTVSRAGR